MQAAPILRSRFISHSDSAGTCVIAGSIIFTSWPSDIAETTHNATSVPPFPFDRYCEGNRPVRISTIMIPRQKTSHLGDIRPYWTASGALNAKSDCRPFRVVIIGLIPYSESIGSLSGRRRMLLDLRFPWGKSVGESLSWRYSRPLAMPLIIFRRANQSRFAWDGPRSPRVRVNICSKKTCKIRLWIW